MDEQKRGDEVSEGPSLTVRQAAALLGLPEARIRRMLREAVLKGHREGGVWRIDADAIRAFKQNQIAGVNAPKPAAGDAMKDTETLQPPSEHGKAAGSDQPSGYQSPRRPTIQPELTTWRYRAGRRTRQLLYEHPRATRPVRRVLWQLASYAEHADRLATFQAHDAEENAKYALPDGETPVLAAVWTIELYIPSSIGGLFQGLRRHPWLRNRDSSSTDPVQWVKDQRGRPWPGG